MKILHTADWHLGIEMAHQPRRHEFECIFKWMLDLIRSRGIEVLLIAGDIYDRQSPSTEAQKMYYDFLREAHLAGIRQVVVIAGNHDSPSFLNASRELLEMLSIHVFGTLGSGEGHEDNIVLLRERDGSPAAAVCAIPHLSMPPKCPDAATKGPHEAYEDAICACYHRIFQRARQLHPDLPVIGMGHFYTPPTPFSEYGTSVGNSTAVNYNRLPPFDYLAMGHMHKGYTLGGNSRWRYSGSLFTTKFQELGPDSQLMLLDTEKGLEPEAVTIPVYQTMKNLTGTREEIIDALTNLKNTEGETIWLHIHNTGDFWVNMHSDVLALLGDSRLVPVDVENSTVSPELREDKFGASTLADIRPEDIFDHMLEQTTLDDGYKRAFRNDLMLMLEECSNEPAEMMEITQEERDEDNENSY